MRVGILGSGFMGGTHARAFAILTPSRAPADGERAGGRLLRRQSTK